jgi:hypothetical protein
MVCASVWGVHGVCECVWPMSNNEVVREREIGRQRDERDACHTSASHRRIPHAPNY